MNVNQALKTCSKDKDYIVFEKRTNNVVYIGSSANEAKNHETSKTITLKPLVKNTVTIEQQKEYLQKPSLYSL